MNWLILMVIGTIAITGVLIYFGRKHEGAAWKFIKERRNRE